MVIVLKKRYFFGVCLALQSCFNAPVKLMLRNEMNEGIYYHYQDGPVLNSFLVPSLYERPNFFVRVNSVVEVPNDRDWRTFISGTYGERVYIFVFKSSILKDNSWEEAVEKKMYAVYDYNIIELERNNWTIILK